MDRRTLAKALLGFAALPAGCGPLGPTFTYHFKIRVYATIDGVERVGTTVVRSVWTYTEHTISAQQWTGENYGDAIWIPDDGKRAYIALLGNVQGQIGGLHISESLFLYYFPRPNTKTEHFEKMKTLAGEREMPPWIRPLVVGFSDVKNIETAQFVWPDRPEVNGPHVEVIRTSLELSGEPESDELPKKLSWFPQVGHQKPKRALLPPQEWLPYQQLQPRNIHADGQQL